MQHTQQYLNKHKIIIIKKSFEKNGYKLLSTIYVNAHAKLKYECANGHKHSISWSNWNAGKRCPFCSGLIKKTIEYVRRGFEKEGYVLLSNKYVNNRQKLRYLCPNKHDHSISWGSWAQGHRCPYCMGVVKPHIGLIEEEFKREGYKLLAKEYRNSAQKLEFICPRGHRHSISWSSWKQGTRCSYCSGNGKRNIKFVRAGFLKEGYKLLTKEYRNNTQKLECVCPNGHLYSVRWRDWNSGRRCGMCADIKNSGEGHWNWQGGISCEPYCDVWLDKEFRETIKQRDGYRCQNPYCNSDNPDDLTVHHIDYNKKSCGPENLITVCRSCNTRANFDRKWHQAWYKAIINKRYYGGNYDTLYISKPE